DACVANAVASRFVLVHFFSSIDFVSYPTTLSLHDALPISTTPGLYVYYWDFGDGAYSLGGVAYGTNSLASHTYSRSGTYFAVLTSQDYTSEHHSPSSHVLRVGPGVVAADFVYPTNNIVAGT